MRRSSALRDAIRRLQTLWAGALPRFLMVGLAGLSLDASLLTLLLGSGMSNASARALSLAAATLLTWRLNRAFTFQASGRPAGAELARYAAVVFLAQSVSYGTFLVLAATLPGWPPVLLLLIGAVTATAVSFGGQRLFTFAPALRP